MSKSGFSFEWLNVSVSLPPKVHLNGLKLDVKSLN